MFIQLVEALGPDLAMSFDPVDGVIEGSGLKMTGAELGLAATRYEATTLQHLEMLRDPLAAASATPGFLQHRWEQMVEAYGAFQSLGTPTISEANEFSVNVPVNWAQEQSTIIVAFDSTGELDHFIFLRANAPPVALLGQVVDHDDESRGLAAAAAADLQAERYDVLAGATNSLGGPSATADRLKKDWQSVTARFGRIRRVDKPVLLGSNSAIVVYEVGLTLDHGSAHVQVSIDDEHHYQDLIVEPGPSTRQFGQ